MDDGSGLVEVDARMGTVLRRVPQGAAEFGPVSYAGPDVIVARSQYIGDVWVADGSF
jgi:hypothetical protein